jgi:hypothetical protein
MKKICIATIEDHSRLGGPMGSDMSTPVVATMPCANEEAALRWTKAWFASMVKMKKLSPDHYPDRVANMKLKEFKKWMGDMGPFGVEFKNEMLYV